MSENTTWLPGSGFSEPDIARLTELIGRLGAAHLPLPELLGGIAQDMPQKSLRLALEQLSADIAKGKSVHDAIERLPDYCSQQSMGMIRLVLESRAPANTLFRLLGHEQARKSQVRAFWTKLFYPILLLISCSLLIGMVFRVVSTQFSPLFKDFGITLPILTVIVLQVADTINQVGLAGSLMPVFLCLALILLASIGINSSLQRWLELSQFCQIMAELLDSQCPLAESLQITRMLIPGRLGRAADDMIDLANNGMSLPDAMDLQQAIPEGASELVRWAQNSGGSGAEGLRVASALYEARSRSHSHFLHSVFTVIAGIIVLWMILLTVVSVFGPMLGLLSALSG
jgi:type II secretory pathway component PulF